MAARFLVSGGIYSITTLVNNKVYIGSAVDFKKRWNTHRHKLRLNKHHSSKLQNSWNKYKESNFSFEIVELVADKNKLIEREQYWIDLLKPNYNIAKIAGSSLGIKRTQEYKDKLSLLNKGQHSSEKTEFKKGYIPHNKGKKGFKQSEEFKKNKILEAKNFWMDRTPEQRKEIGSKISISKKEKKQSEETKEKIRKTMLLKNRKNGTAVSC